jgi:flagellar basal body-associated protein FliL
MSAVMLVLLIVAGVMMLWMVGWGIFWFLAQAGVVVQKAMEPPTTDTSNYTLNQGREVKSEER